MPKMKTHKATKKRVKLTAKNKVKAHSPYTSHLMQSKNGKEEGTLEKAVSLQNAKSRELFS